MRASIDHKDSDIHPHSHKPAPERYLAWLADDNTESHDRHRALHLSLPRHFQFAPDADERELFEFVHRQKVRRAAERGESVKVF